MFPEKTKFCKYQEIKVLQYVDNLDWEAGAAKPSTNLRPLVWRDDQDY